MTTLFILNLANTEVNKEWFKGRIAFDCELIEANKGQTLVVKLSHNPATNQHTRRVFWRYAAQLMYTGICMTTRKLIGSPADDVWIKKNLTAKQADLI